MMLVKPWIDGGGDWSYVHSVWAHWQTWNSAVIALFASLLAVYVVRYQDEQQRERKLMAARALLPAVLSDLSTCIEKLAKFYLDTFSYWQLPDEGHDREDRPHPPFFEDDHIAEAFSKCMEVAVPHEVKLLAKVLSMRQYILARTSSEYNDRSLVREELWRANIQSQLLELAEMRVYVGRLFDYGRELDRL